MEEGGKRPTPAMIFIHGEGEGSSVVVSTRCPVAGECYIGAFPVVDPRLPRSSNPCRSVRVLIEQCGQVRPRRRPDETRDGQGGGPGACLTPALALPCLFPRPEVLPVELRYDSASISKPWLRSLVPQVLRYDDWRKCLSTVPTGLVSTCIRGKAGRKIANVFNRCTGYQ